MRTEPYRATGTFSPKIQPKPAGHRGFPNGPPVRLEETCKKYGVSSKAFWAPLMMCRMTSWPVSNSNVQYQKNQVVLYNASEEVLVGAPDASLTCGIPAYLPVRCVLHRRVKLNDSLFDDRLEGVSYSFQQKPVFCIKGLQRINLTTAFRLFTASSEKRGQQREPQKICDTSETPLWDLMLMLLPVWMRVLLF